jgi:hypothetical protein
VALAPAVLAREPVVVVVAVALAAVLAREPVVVAAVQARRAEERRPAGR